MQFYIRRPRWFLNIPKNSQMLSCVLLFTSNFLLLCFVIFCINMQAGVLLQNASVLE